MAQAIRVAQGRRESGQSAAQEQHGALAGSGAADGLPAADEATVSP